MRTPHGKDGGPKQSRGQRENHASGRRPSPKDTQNTLGLVPESALPSRYGQGSIDLVPPASSWIRSTGSVFLATYRELRRIPPLRTMPWQRRRITSAIQLNQRIQESVECRRLLETSPTAAAWPGYCRGARRDALNRGCPPVSVWLSHGLRSRRVPCEAWLKSGLPSS